MTARFTSTYRAFLFEMRSRALARREPSTLLDACARFGRVHPSLTTLEPGSELMADGFQGSANSYFFVCFEQAQPAKVRIRGHEHSPVKVRSAVRTGIPTIITIRPPVPTVVSLVSRWSHVTLAQGLRSYYRFYDGLSDVRSEVVVASFDEIIRDMKSIIARTNAKFDTRFALPEPIPRPESSSSRETKKELLRDALTTDPRLRGLTARCDGLYEKYVSP